MEAILKELILDLETVMTGLKVNNVDIVNFDSDFTALVLNYAEYADNGKSFYFNLYLAGKCTNIKALSQYIQNHQDMEDKLPFDYEDTNRKKFKSLTLLKYVIIKNNEDVQVEAEVHKKGWKLILVKL